MSEKSDLDSAIRQLMNAFINSIKPLSLKEAIENPTPLHEEALHILIRNDRITSAGVMNRYEIL